MEEPSTNTDREAADTLRRSRIYDQLEKEILSHAAMKDIEVSYDRLDRLELKLCLLFLSIFPKNEVLKKGPLIYWWIGEGLIKTEEQGDKILEELLKYDLIMGKSVKSLPVSKFTIHPWIRYMLISKAKQAKLFDFDDKGTPLFHATQSFSRRACLIFEAEKSPPDINSEKLRTIFNVNEKYLDFKSEWVAKLKNLAVLQLGRWKKSPEHHIEVLSDALLKGLGTQKLLKYLSLRGISLITELPPTIVDLVNLEILDLKACYNLEKLPDDISSLRKLTHCNVSECYFLESMPKGLEKLTSLQVLKGFVMGNSKSATQCSIRDLAAHLKSLKRLSIYIGSEAMIPDGEFNGLKDISSLRCLKISYSVVSEKLRKEVIKQPFSFPQSLEKLDLEGIPHEKPPWLVPSNLSNLKMLSIKGGELIFDTGAGHMWTSVKILRLKYLYEQPNLHVLFPSLVDKNEIEIKKSRARKPPSKIGE